MREVVGNLWTHPADLYVVTTNGATRKDGQAIMGRGCAKEIADANSGPEGIAAHLGRMLELYGNHAFWLGWWQQPTTSVTGRPHRIEVMSFPVKHHWQEKADLTLIRQSAARLRLVVRRSRWDRVVLPRPGCGNGGRDWAEVAPILHDLLDDDTFEVIDFGPVAGRLL